MEENQYNEDPDVVIISGNLENFLEGDKKNKKVINRDEIYDLSEIHPDSNKKLLDEENSNREKENPIISLDNFADENSHIDRSENNKEPFEPEIRREKDEIQENEEEITKPQEKTPKKLQSNNNSPISKTPKNENTSPTNKTPKNDDKNNNSPKNKTPKNDDNSSINETPKNDEPPIKSIIIAKSAKDLTKNEQVKREGEEEFKQESDAQNPEEKHLKEKEHTHKKKEKKEKNKGTKIKKKKKPKTNTKTFDEDPPQIISIGIPIRSDDIFEKSSNTESPDFLIS